MGLLVSRWKVKPSTIEILEGLDKDIQALEEHGEQNQKQLRVWLSRLLFYSALLYLSACTVVYTWYVPEQMIGKMILASPFLLFPLIVWLLRKSLIVLYGRRTERNNEKLQELKAEKERILEQVMETETYKNAKLILERFSPASKKKLVFDAPPPGPSATPKPGQELRRRHVAPAAVLAAPGGPPEKGRGATAPPTATRNTPLSGAHPPGPPLARPVLPRERGSVDRIIEYFVGDGPQNRYALVCQQCASHNGMALREEFEYIAFRCAYCYFLNPARKTRPQAPRLLEYGAETSLCQDPPLVAMETDLPSSHPDPAESRDDASGQVKVERGEPPAAGVPSDTAPDPHADPAEDSAMDVDV